MARAVVAIALVVATMASEQRAQPSLLSAGLYCLHVGAEIGCIARPTLTRRRALETCMRMRRHPSAAIVRHDCGDRPSLAKTRMVSMSDNKARRSIRA